MIAIYGMLVTGLAFIAFATVYFWPSDPEKKDQEIVSPVVKAVCSVGPRPTHALPDRRLFITEIGDPRWMTPANIFSNMWMPPGAQELKMTDDNFPTLMARCAITNFSQSNLFGVTMRFKVSFMEIVKSENGRASGETVKTAIMESPKFDLGATNQSEGFFYISNHSGYFVQLELEPTATTLPASGGAPIEINLIRGDFTETFAGLWPMDLKLQQAATPATPTPLNTQEGK